MSSPVSGFSFENVPKQMSSLFNNATPKLYWHYVAKHVQNESKYAKETIGVLVKQIAGKLKENSFERPAEHGWTPLHVAAIAGNKAAIQFLFNQNVKRNIKDEFGHTARQYVEHLHPELTELFCYPHQTASPIHEILEPVFKKWAVELPALKGPYKQHTDDFGRQITSLAIGEPERKNSNERILNDTSNVCQKLGITVKRMEQGNFIRDFWMRLHNGNLIIPTLNLGQNVACERANSHAYYFNTKSNTRTNNPYFKTGIGTNASHLAQSIMSPDKGLVGMHKFTEATFHFEGGNTFTLTNRQGKIKVLIGKEHRLITLNTFRKEHPEVVQTLKPQIEQLKLTLKPEKIRKVAEYMYAQGILKQEDHTGFLSREQIVTITSDLFINDKHFKTSSDPEAHAYRQKALQMGFLKPFAWSEKIARECIDSVAKYQVQKYLCHNLIAKDLNQDLGDVHYIPQVGYHLDVFMRPGPNHSVFVQDYLMVYELLSSIHEKAEQLKLSESDVQLLKEYMNTAKKLHDELGPLLKKVHQKLANADLNVIPMPGCFMHEPKGLICEEYFRIPTQNINFVNALSGWSDKTKRYYYITTGCQAGERLGGILMDAFDLFLKKYVPNIDTFYVGRNPDKADDFSEPMARWNRGSCQSGVHCFTFETATADHDGREKT